MDGCGVGGVGEGNIGLAVAVSCVFCSEPCIGVWRFISRLEEKLRGSSDTLFSPPTISLKRRIVYLSTGTTGRSSWDDLRRYPKGKVVLINS